MADVQSMELTLLDEKEIVELNQLETTIEKGLETFMEVGSALAEINDKKLWRQTHASFVDYARERWGMGKSQAYRLINAAETVASLSPVGENVPQPQNERQIRALSSLAPERRQEAWERAVGLAEGGEVTADHVRAVVDVMLGKKGRFDNDVQYPVYHKGKLIFKAPGKFNEIYGDKRFWGVCEPVSGKALNASKQYEAYSLIDVPEVHPQPIEAAFPNFQTNANYPVDRTNRMIFDAPVDIYARPTNTYLNCQWLSGYEVRRAWDLVVEGIGDFQIAPAREISTEWLATSAFQPGMMARCPKCEQGWHKADALQPYEKWQPIERGIWRCEKGDRVEDAKLTFEMQEVQLPGTPAATVDDDDEDEQDEESGPDGLDEGPSYEELTDVLDMIINLDELLETISEKPALVRMALDEDTVADYRKSKFVAKGQLTDDAITIVKKWLDAGE